MKRGRLLIGLAVALILGLILAEVVYKAMSQANTRQTVTTSQIVVAATQMPLGTRLQAQDLKLISWPAGEPIQGVFTRIQDCVDRALITPVLPGEPILEGKLAPKDAGAGLPAVIPEGMRAVSVAVNDVVAVAGFAQPGTSVDVMFTGQSLGGGPSENVTRTILEDVRVLAAGQKTEQDRQGQATTVTVITLLVTPEDADKLAMANTMGRIQLALRNSIDANKTAPPPLFQGTLLGSAPAPAPVPVSAHVHAKAAAPPAPPAYSVEVIRASKRETSEFPNQ
ncbi:MAG TPA: Flp pilus assembly protein CpaB [Candidatus Acidoferrales bacterium]